MKYKINDPEVASVFKTYPNPFNKELLKLRELVFEVAKDIDELDELIETLKWGRPSYLPKKKNVGTTVRIHWLSSKPDQFGMYFNCNTDMILKIKRKFKRTFNYEGKRALIFKLDEKVPENELRESIKMALLYHINKRN